MTCWLSMRGSAAPWATDSLYLHQGPVWSFPFFRGWLGGTGDSCVPMMICKSADIRVLSTACLATCPRVSYSYASKPATSTKSSSEIRSVNACQAPLWRTRVPACVGGCVGANLWCYGGTYAGILFTLGPCISGDVDSLLGIYSGGISDAAKVSRILNPKP